jgi:hypothetical protein
MKALTIIPNVKICLVETTGGSGCKSVCPPVPPLLDQSSIIQVVTQMKKDTLATHFLLPTGGVLAAGLKYKPTLI